MFAMKLDTPESNDYLCLFEGSDNDRRAMVAMVIALSNPSAVVCEIPQQRYNQPLFIIRKFYKALSENFSRWR